MEKILADRLRIDQKRVRAVIRLLDEGATIPFIARYRKEATHSMDEVTIGKISEERKKLLELSKRKTSILERLKELNIQDTQFIQQIQHCFDPKKLEDLYLPYKPKRRTKASIAREQGLEPLAKIIMSQKSTDLEGQALRFTSNNMQIEAVFQGARDIIAEWINEHAYTRRQIRFIYQKTARLLATVIEKKQPEAQKYRDYFDFNQKINGIQSHRLLAILRAEKEGLLKVKITINSDLAIEKIESVFLKSKSTSAKHIKKAAADAFKRLIMPSLDNEIRKDAKAKADDEAIQIFSNNVRQLLMSPPLQPANILALDPGFRTGCKVVCLNKQGEVLAHATIYPHPPQKRKEEASQSLIKFINRHNIKAIAIGNGTAGRETQQFVKTVLKNKDHIEIYLISESGASIYSASAIGRAEFPNLDITVRGAISIGRRLLDPMAELVKIDPKSIGVGQYQHDVVQEKLKQSLDTTVSSCVNQVGVNLNTASQHLLQYVAGIGPKLSENIVKYRSIHGRFKNRNELLKVKGLGAKAFEQSAGFLRIKNGENTLDRSAVHPERYTLVKNMAQSANHSISELIGSELLINKIDLSQFITSEVGLPTLKDILNELRKPGLDPRGIAKSISFDDQIRTINDLKINMVLPGKITNLTKFGAFVDIGIKENGLIHKSQIANRFIHDPAEVLRLDQEVKVKILDLDIERKRIQLSMKL